MHLYIHLLATNTLHYSTYSLEPRRQHVGQRIVDTGDLTGESFTRMCKILTISSNAQEEFCPPLDTALIAAVVADYPQETKDQRAAALSDLRELLSALVPDAAADQTQEDSGRDSSLSAPTEESGSTFGGTGEASSATSTNGSGGMESTLSESALDFLRASFPHIDVKKLRAKLDETEQEVLDMEKLVEEILSEELVRELEERGVKDEDELAEKMDEWHVVRRKSQRKAKDDEGPEDNVNHWHIVQKSTSQAKKKRKGKSITLSDVRQQQHSRQLTPNPHPAGDPWNQLTSIATYLESLLQARTSAFFLSYLHKPEYNGPADAVRAALAAIAQDQPSNSASGDVQEADHAYCEGMSHEETLFTLIEFLCLDQKEGFENFDEEARERLCRDADLALRVTHDQADYSLEIVKLLQELDADGDGSREMGVYHSPASPRPSSGINKAAEVIVPSIPTRTIPSSVVPSQLPASTVPKPKPPPAPNQTTTSNGNGWQEVKVRPKALETHPLAVHIPAYDPYNVPRRKVRGSGNAIGKGGKGDIGELKSPLKPKFGPAVRSAAVPPPSPSFKRQARLVNGAISWSHKHSINELRARRDEALRQASRYWAQGSARNRGGEVAWHYALEAQRFQEEGRQLKLDAARELVEGKRWVWSLTGVYPFLHAMLTIYHTQELNGKS